MTFKTRKDQKETHTLNEKIRHPEVRVTQSGDDINGVHRTSEAIKIAESKGFDLIEISADANPPICRIMDYSKFKYEKRKREKDNKDKSKSKPLKEIKFGPNTGEHDFNFKLNHARNFLLKGHKVKAYVQFRGREMAFKEKGELMLLRFAEALGTEGKVEDLPKLNGKKMFMTISPRLKK